MAAQSWKEYWRSRILAQQDGSLRPLELKEILALLRESEHGTVGPRSYMAKVALLQILLEGLEVPTETAYMLQDQNDADILRYLGYLE